MDRMEFPKSKVYDRFPFFRLESVLFHFGKIVCVLFIFCFPLVDALAQGASGGEEFQVDGNFILVSSGNSTNVLAYDVSNGAFVDVFASGGGLSQPRGFGLRPGVDLLVCNSFSDNVLQFSALTGKFVRIFSTPAGRPVGLTIGPDGSLFVGLPELDRVDQYDGQTGEFLGTFVSAGSGGLDQPNNLLFHTDGNLYLASSLSADSVLRYDGTTGDFIDEFVSSGSGGLDDTQDLTFGPDGNLYVSSGETDEVLKYNGQTGAFMEAFVGAGSGGLDYPKGIRFGPDGHLYVCSYDTDEILRYDGQTGAFLDDFVKAGSGGLNGPINLEFHTVDTSSNDNWRAYE
ncbi:MAG: hypothetical protein KC964_18010 [Candidatus Omnitrophica bacterium]|nr:hypothetical protein [Candidatus Omnitrophota bacterium]